MSVRVLLPNAFQKHTNNVREISSTAANLPELVTEIEGRFPALRQHLRLNLQRRAQRDRQMRLGIERPLFQQLRSLSLRLLRISSRLVIFASLQRRPPHPRIRFQIFRRHSPLPAIRIQRRLRRRKIILR